LPGVDEGVGRLTAKLADRPFYPRRALRLAEQHLALADIDAFHTSARVEFERDLRDILGDMVRGARGKIADALKDGDPSELASLNLDAKLLNKAVEVFVERARAFGYRQATAEKKKQPATLIRRRQAGKPGFKAVPFAAYERLFKLAEEEEEKDEPFPKPDDELTPTPRPAQRVDKLVKAQTQLVSNRIKNRLRQTLQDWAIDVARRGGGEDEVIDGVLDDIEASKTLRTDAGMVLSRSFSMGREQFAQEHGEEIAAVEYSAILDSVTCAPCQGEDGKVFDFNSAEHDAHVPPYSGCDGGNNCRCLLVYQYGEPGFREVGDE
jgi:hypothetical protein